MITDILGGKADAASSAKQAVGGRKDPEASSNSFSDALSGLDRDLPPQQPEDDVLENEGRPSSLQDRVAIEAKSAKSKPVIDIRPESLRRPSDELKHVESPGQRLETSEERLMTPAEKKLRDALAAAKAMARKSDELHEKDVTEKRVAVDKAGPQDEDATLDTSMLEADDAKIAEVFTLLTGSEAKSGELNAMMPKNAAGLQGRRTKDGDGPSNNMDAVAVKDSGRSILAGSGEDQLPSMPSDPEAGAGETRLFRFSNARGEGQRIDMAISRGRDEPSTVEFRSPSSGAAENVAVLESRRFLGLAPNSNGANLTAMLAGDPEWTAAAHPSAALSNAATQSSTGTVVNMLKLQMNPHELGAVTATLRLHGDELNVHLTVETRAAYRQLSEDSGGILDGLRAQGFAVDRVTISIAPTPTADGASGQQGQAGQAGQQAMAEGGRQGHETGRGQEQAAGERTRNSNEAVSENTQLPGSGNAHPGQLYL